MKSSASSPASVALKSSTMAPFEFSRSKQPQSANARARDAEVRLIRTKERPRGRLECQRRGRFVKSLRQRHGAIDDNTMAAMHAVEITERDDRVFCSAP